MKNTTGKTERTRDPKRLQELATAAAFSELAAMGVTWWGWERDTEAARQEYVEALRFDAGINAPDERKDRFKPRGDDREVLANYASVETYQWWWGGPDGLTARKLALLSVLLGIPDWQELCLGPVSRLLGKLAPSAADAIADERKKLTPYAKSCRRGRLFVKDTAKAITPTS